MNNKIVNDVDGPSRRQVLASLGASASAVITTGMAGCLGSSMSESGDAYDIGMTAIAYTPQEITVTVGESVVWQNTSSRGHTVTAYESGIPDEASFFATGGYETEDAAREAFRNDLGGLIDGGETWEYTFDIPGTYEYLCIPHEQQGMIGTVIVESTG
ncbi:plastocyanin/azurin family copper-binding protein [Haloquadratum walsbyi]|jgi:Plastocyanin|uniref:Plastocyanin n=1 Tax=Haloquadratum walsbyi J07HQW2 TaxID=1238425 RepID=U1NC84_9EURY|nr:plastocyanin/azurin family copper-binding protein [Haloquadratum walsbyi]ERG94520.1 MAG: plastocyanin [Haloquadratum walsbyi J07HQW2]